MLVRMSNALFFIIMGIGVFVWLLVHGAQACGRVGGTTTLAQDERRTTMNEPKRAVLVIGEAVGKRIRRLSLAEPYTKSREIYLTIEFDDRTEILIGVDCRPCFGITHLARDPHGEMGPVKESMRGSIRPLAKALR